MCLNSALRCIEGGKSLVSDSCNLTQSINSSVTPLTHVVVQPNCSITVTIFIIDSWFSSIFMLLISRPSFISVSLVPLLSKLTTWLRGLIPSSIQSHEVTLSQFR